MSTLDDMIDQARAVRDRAYAPYSNFHVGACLRTKSGKLYAGANVENAAYPQGQCAEASAIGAMVAGGDTEIVEVVVIGGGCRQRLTEFADADTPVHVCGPEGLRKTFTLGELLPGAFGPRNLDQDPTAK
jgi:cytidine deaminase